MGITNPPIHPGEHLAEFLEEYGIKPYSLAKSLKLPRNRIERLVRRETGLSADTAFRLARFFGTTPEMWMNMQSNYEMSVAHIQLGKTLDEIEPIKAA